MPSELELRATIAVLREIIKAKNEVLRDVADAVDEKVVNERGPMSSIKVIRARVKQGLEVDITENKKI